MIRGISVTLWQLSRSGSSPVWTQTTVDNVLVAPVNEVDSSVAQLPDGHRAIYHLGIPKSDAHTWEGQLVQFWGKTWSVIGIPTRGIDAMVPGPWNTKVYLELYRTDSLDPNQLWADSVELISGTATADNDGYDGTVSTVYRTVSAIFTQGPKGSFVSEDGKAGIRSSAIVELWTGDWEGEQKLRHNSIVYDLTAHRPSGHGTELLELEEVWR